MSIRMTGSEAQLEGDWTLTGLTCNLDSIALSLQQLESENGKDLRVDCGQIKEADISGLQLLNVWMQCARFRGVKPMLVNVPERLRHSMHVLVSQCFMDTCPETALLAG